LLGIGISYLFPLLLGTAAKVEAKASAAATVARVSTLGYLGSFAGPALIGSLAGPIGLATALVLPAVLVAGATLVAARVVPRSLRQDVG
jgi:cyanate permease